MIKNKKVLQGQVCSDKMEKTRVVLVEGRVKHPFYGKVIKKNTKYMVHDSANASKMGDIVQIVYAKPLSRHKSWELLKVVKKGN